MFGDVRRRDDDLRQADAVVGDEDDFDEVADAAVVVDDFGDVVDEVDDFFRGVVGARGFTREDVYARHPVGIQVFQDAVVAVDDLQDVQQLSLVFVDALDLDVKECVRADFDAQFAVDPFGESAFVFVFDGWSDGANALAICPPVVALVALYAGADEPLFGWAATMTPAPAKTIIVPAMPYTSLFILILPSVA